MTLVKICGIREPGSCLAAIEAGADFIGMVFAPSRRRVTAETAAELSSLVHSSKPGVAAVGVFVNQPLIEVNQTALEFHLDRVQLSGDESWNYCAAVGRPVIKAFHISETTQLDQISRKVDEGFQRLGSNLVVLLDTAVPGLFGGTGTTFQWQRVRELIGRDKLMIAGGLDPENIGNFVREFGPWGVDVSSGVETQGEKDVRKISDFILNARSISRREPNAGYNEK